VFFIKIAKNHLIYYKTNINNLYNRKYMGHITSKSYLDLQKRLEKSPQGAPASESLFKILEILFTEKEAKLVSALPIKFFTAKKAAKIWKVEEKKAKEILNELSDKGILLDIKKGNEQEYILAPTMAGFFEFSIMRTDGKFDRKILSELFHQYINVEEDFVPRVLGLDPCIARTFIQEKTLQKKHESIILDYERASNVIKTASCITVGTCYCRHKMEHKGKACKMPQDVCLTFNNAAKSLSKHGIAKKITKKEAMKVLDRCVEHGLVQVGDNIQDHVGWICNCCGCCCEALLAYKKLGYNMKINSNFFAEINDEKCKNCGVCAKKCPVDAIDHKDLKKIPKISVENCIGCGVCTRFCPTKCMKMERRSETKFVPKDTFERFIVCAINEGKLQNLIFDNFSLWTNEVLRRFVGIIFKLPPAKQLLANKQLQSKFLATAFKSHMSDEYRKTMHEKAIKTRYDHPELKKKH